MDGGEAKTDATMVGCFSVYAAHYVSVGGIHYQAVTLGVLRPLLLLLLFS